MRKPTRLRIVTILNMPTKESSRRTSLSTRETLYSCECSLNRVKLSLRNARITSSLSGRATQTGGQKCPPLPSSSQRETFCSSYGRAALQGMHESAREEIASPSQRGRCGEYQDPVCLEVSVSGGL